MSWRLKAAKPIVPNLLLGILTVLLIRIEPTLYAIATSPATPHPLIQTLQTTDSVFLQFQQDVEENRILLARYRQELLGNNMEALQRLAQRLTIYRYQIKPGDDIFSIAARCTLPYESIVTLNRIAHPTLLQNGKELLLPSLPALFIPNEAETDLERLITGAHAEQKGFSIRAYPEGKALDFFCLPDQDFSGTERAFFLNAAFRYPLPVIRITSVFGLRENPVTGTVKVHEGLDLAAPIGTPVYTCRDGVVTSINKDPTYGNYVVVTHEGGWASLYGHLATVLTSLRSHVHSGALIGTVGVTGQTTGPHLHFELRQDGKARDPVPLLPGKGKN